MTEREKNEICKGYADLIIRKEQLIREIWKTEFGIRNKSRITNVLQTKDMDRSRTRSPPNYKGNIVTGKQTKYYNKTPIKVETIEQYKEYVDAVKYWQSIKKYDGKRKKGNM